MDERKANDFAERLRRQAETNARREFQTGPAARPPYRVPHMRRIGRGQDTEDLYQAEDRRDTAIWKAADELWTVLVRAGILESRPDSNYYRDVLPEALFSILESQDANAALLAALAFLRWYKDNRQETYRTALQTYRLECKNQIIWSDDLTRTSPAAAQIAQDWTEPRMYPYQLADGTIILADDSATKGAEIIDYTTAERGLTNAYRVPRESEAYARRKFTEQIKAAECKDQHASGRICRLPAGHTGDHYDAERVHWRQADRPTDRPAESPAKQETRR